MSFSELSERRRCFKAGVRVPAGNGNFPLHHRVQTGFGAHPTYVIGTRALSLEVTSRSVKLTIHLHLLLRSRSVELYLPSTNTPSWRGAQLKHRDSFSTLLYNTLIRKVQENEEILMMIVYRLKI
jgi:hypothetical protein